MQIHTIQQLKGHRGVNILPPVFAVCGNGNLPVGPFAGQMNTNTSHNGWAVLQAECSQVETAAKRAPMITKNAREKTKPINTIVTLQ